MTSSSVLPTSSTRMEKTMISAECDTRIPYRLGTDYYCKFENCDEYVHMGDLVEVGEDRERR